MHLASRWRLECTVGVFVEVCRVRNGHVRYIDCAVIGPSAAAHWMLGLRFPKAARRGTPSDVSRVLPLLYELSVGARRGVPGWVPQPPIPAALTTREPNASWLELTYPFSKDEELRHLYMLADGEGLRAGMFLEEVDAFSADCAARHADIYHPERPLSVVTAAHSGLSIFENLSARHDLRLRGCVVSVGSSSMEVRTDLFRCDLSEDTGTAEASAGHGGAAEEFLGSCYTVMVARDRASFDSARVHGLMHDELGGGAEAAASSRRSAVRKALAANALAHKPPSEAEVPLLHALWMEARAREVNGSSRADAGGGDDGDGSDAVMRVPLASSEQRALEVMQVRSPRHLPPSLPISRFSRPLPASDTCARGHAAGSSQHEWLQCALTPHP